MVEQALLDKHYFNHLFLKFRIQYYFHETKELIARHKLLTGFIICFLAPGVKNIQALGIPFYVLIDPLSTFKAKLIYLFLLVFCVFSMTKAQLPFIKGGVFRDYLHTLSIPMYVHKTIDFIILLFSLNIVWLAVFFGGINIFLHAESSLFLSSQLCLYASTLFALFTLLYNFLYKKITNSIVLFSVLILVAFISRRGNWLLNYNIGISVALLCGGIIWKIKPFVSKQSTLIKISLKKLSHFLNYFILLKNIFVIQLAVLRKNKTSFFTRLAFSLAFFSVILQVLISPEILDNKGVIVLILLNLQTYILSTLFILFEKEKLDHILFHQIFPYQRLIQPIKEIIVVWIILMVLLVQVDLFYVFNLKDHCRWLAIILAINSIVLIINRILYAQSLSFCLFTSLLSAVAWCFIQYIFLGV